MKQYIGTKTLMAKPMTRGEYNDYRGWDIPDGEDQNDAGYLVEYPYDEETVPNHEAHLGHISWLPTGVFEGLYRKRSGMSFSRALEAIKRGNKLAREGWNGKGMFVFLVPGSTFTHLRPPLSTMFPEGTEITYRPHIDLCAADGSLGVWQPSMGDVMAEDWHIVEDVL
ncbi:DUF2829 domain-containing protein [uncultured Pelagimonas sp.]|uniref:DUF2829 domain-containing protein n=1 Tax=uncultured Pelagimonas sp. TaxID=1618102 RepID=UPI00261DA358|nr:DUF2829 domain-containing protein [uncultured Pelagimonas sp.]